MAKHQKIEEKGIEIAIYQGGIDDYISLTDLAKHKDSNSTDDIIKNWLRNRNTIELLVFWESLYYSAFNPVEFDGFRKQAGLNSLINPYRKMIKGMPLVVRQNNQTPQKASLNAANLPLC